MSIKKTLRFTILIFSIIPITIVSIIAYTQISERLLTVKHDSLQQLAETNSTGLEALIKTQQTEVNLLAIQKQIYNLVLSSKYKSKMDSAYYNSTYDKASSILLERSKLYTACERITLYDQEKQVVASSDESYVGKNYSDSQTLAYMSATSKTACSVSGLIKTTNENNEIAYCIEIGSPIFDSTNATKPIGYIVSTINISYFKEFLNLIETGKTGSYLVLDRTGTIIYDKDTQMIGTSIKSLKLSRLVTNYYAGLLSQSGNFEYVSNGANALYGYRIIPELNWVLLVRQDISEITDLANIILYVLAWTFGVLIIIIFIVSNIITKLYASPIIELKNAMSIASQGNLNVQSYIKSKNEIGELSRSFNKMIHIIKENYNELSSMRDELVLNEEQLRNNFNHIEYLAYHDVLTTLPNKLSFINRVNNTLSSSFGLNQIHAIYFIDLDNFKTINDTLGHDYGDNLLTQTATQLLSLTTPDDLLARAGGDEFLLFRENLKSQDDAINFAAAIIDAFKDPFNLNGEIAYVSMSIGIALYPKNGATTNILIKNADIAMYKSKDTGKNKYTVFDISMEDELNRNAVVLEVLRHAIQNNEIYVTYQPQINLSTNKITGFEALMRINSAKLGPLPPNEFIPVAEESGLIIELGEWILRESCLFAKSLIDQGFPPYKISVNISTVQINRAGFVSMIENVLKETELPPEYLELEITESALLSSLVNAAALLNSLQELGVDISLDDFGTGYSSLNYLTSMPINTLKIDKSFINNISNNKKDYYIADTIIQLAHSIDIKVVAEGVEHKEQLELLKHKQCDIVQGYVFSKPLLPFELISKLKNEKDAASP